MADSPAAPVPAEEVPSAEQQEKQLVDEEPGIKIFAGNLDYSVTDEDLKRFFAPVEADVLSCNVILRGTRSAGYGFVNVATDEAATKAVEALNGQEFQGRKAIIERAKPAEEKERERSERNKTKRRNGRRGSKAVPGEVTEAEANGEAEKPAATADADGENKPKKKKKKNTAKKLKNKVKDALTPGENGAPAEGAEGAAATEGEKKPRAPKAKRTPKPRRAAGEEPNGEQSKTTLFVANLPFTLDDAGLGALFSDAGFTVNSARVVRRRWGHPRKSKGYGFVDVGDEAEQSKALEALQGKEIDDGKGGVRQVAVKIAVNPHNDDEAVETADGEKIEKPEAAAEVPVAAAPEAAPVAA